MKKVLSLSVLSVLTFVVSLSALISNPSSAHADEFTPTTPQNLSVWAANNTFSMSWTTPDWKLQESTPSTFGYNLKWQLRDQNGNPVEAQGGANLRANDSRTQGFFYSRTYWYAGTFPQGAILDVWIQACNRSCTQNDYASPWSTAASATLSNFSPNDPTMPVVTNPYSPTPPPSTVTNHDADKPAHCAENSIVASLINPVKFDNPDSNDLNAAANVDGKLIVPAQEHEVVCLSDTPGMSFHSDGIYLPKEYANHKLSVFIYSAPKYVGTGIVEENGHLFLPDIDKYSGVHAIALYNENSEIVAKETILVGEKPILKTTGKLIASGFATFTFFVLALVFINANSSRRRSLHRSSSRRAS